MSDGHLMFPCLAAYLPSFCFLGWSVKHISYILVSPLGYVLHSTHFKEQVDYDMVALIVFLFSLFSI